MLLGFRFVVVSLAWGCLGSLGCGNGGSGASGSDSVGMGGGGLGDDGGGTGGASGTSGGSSGQRDAALGPPTFETQFVSGDGFTSRSQPRGSVRFGVDDAAAEDHNVVTLLFPGDPQLGSNDGAGPTNASEIDSSQTFSFGTFRTRVKFARCTTSEELVNGIFTYFNDGTDHNGDMIVDNSEIDIEVLCSNPAKISLTVWSQYSSDTNFIKLTRVVDLSTGDYSESPSDHEYGLVPKGRDAAFRHPGFPSSDTFYEMGFEWHEGEVRYFIVLEGQEITLWDLKDAAHVPKLDAPFLFNLWHAPQNWWTGASADYPAADATMTVDWFRYWKE
ncbi:MAG TPA: glycoside hydrolase family 16 protein [Polyangiaceae bacterium]